MPTIPGPEDLCAEAGLAAEQAGQLDTVSFVPEIQFNIYFVPQVQIYKLSLDPSMTFSLLSLLSH